MSAARPDRKLWTDVQHERRFGGAPPLPWPGRLKYPAVSAAARLHLRAVVATADISATGDEALRTDLARGRARALMVCWHNRMPGAVLYTSQLCRARLDFRLVTIVSASRDGEYLARLCRDLGGFVIRGSSSRDAAGALLAASRALESGASLITVGDGPRGPRYVLKPGPILLAKLSGVPLVPFTWAASRVAQLHRAWDQMMVPLPFTRIEFRFGQPLPVPPDAGPREIARLRREFERRLNALTEWADSRTRVSWQIPRPRPGEVLKRRDTPGLEGRRA